VQRYKSLLKFSKNAFTPQASYIANRKVTGIILKINQSYLEMNESSRNKNFPGYLAALPHIAGLLILKTGVDSRLIVRQQKRK
jgi:hypothetical protein